MDTAQTPTSLTDEARSPRLDDSLDETIVEAAAELLAEVGYDAMSMDAVAARAGVGKATIYRRWSGKAPLVLDTVRARGFLLDHVPDTGRLRDDLLALFFELRSLLDQQALDHLGGVLVAMRSHSELGDAATDQFLAAWAGAIREIAARAMDRGEIPQRDDEFLELFSKTGPSIVGLRFLMADGPTDKAFMTRLIDDILLPALRAA
jgi:AcrR family transcriptional regulator